MAKKEMSMPSTDDAWKTRDDANDIMRYAALRKDMPRHAKAMAMIAEATDLDPGRKPSRKPSRDSRRASGR